MKIVGADNDENDKLLDNDDDDDAFSGDNDTISIVSHTPLPCDLSKHSVLQEQTVKPSLIHQVQSSAQP